MLLLLLIHHNAIKSRKHLLYFGSLVINWRDCVGLPSYM